MSKRHLYLLSLSLTLLGFGLFGYKTIVLDFPVIPHTQAQLWDVEVHLTFSTQNKPVKASLFLPRNTRRYAVVDENFISHGFGLTTINEESNRQAIWSKRQATGKQSLYYRGTVRRVETTEPPLGSKPPIPQKPRLEGAKLEAATALLADIYDKSADTGALVAELTTRLRQPRSDHNLQLLLGKKPSLVRKLELATKILALSPTSLPVSYMGFDSTIILVKQKSFIGCRFLIKISGNPMIQRPGAQRSQIPI